MNIEKVKNYNQKVLAAIGTVVLILALIGLVSAIVVLVSELFDGRRYHREEQGILSEERAEELVQENKRRQIISYTTPRLVDTTNSIYIIPVSHRTLDQAEPIVDDPVLGLVDGKFSSYDKGYYGSNRSSYNNIIVYNSKEGSNFKLFNTRINIGKIATKYFEDEIIVLFEVADTDSNKDGVINFDDLKSLVVYSLKSNKQYKIYLPNADVYNYQFDNATKDLIVHFGLDYNNNGEYESNIEPSVLKKYIYSTRELIHIVDDSIRDELQKTLEGTN